MADSWWWQASTKGKFSTKEMYNAIVEVAYDEQGDFFPWERLWWKAVSTKVLAFLWKTVRERLVTKDNLLKRGIFDGVGAGMCSMCLGP